MAGNDPVDRTPFSPIGTFTVFRGSGGSRGIGLRHNELSGYDGAASGPQLSKTAVATSCGARNCGDRVLSRAERSQLTLGFNSAKSNPTTIRHSAPIIDSVAGVPTSVFRCSKSFFDRLVGDTTSLRNVTSDNSKSRSTLTSVRGSDYRLH